ncbi:hypothetical protein SAMN03159343_0251 [Klenkia marina]|uniref:Uncharacterized protein n=1 Tax=Klenkia marina TaxID=1960309 RepID=A0A1G4X9U0_9ACTN|nr:hypothetical protein [Klenkia marina]SCX37957.1 hypothetical protein SAMN03159343_0251 [Klenkia marina]
MSVENSDVLAWFGQALEDPSGVDAALQGLDAEELHEAAVKAITFTALMLSAQQTQGDRLIHDLRATLNDPDAHMQAYRDWLERVPLGHTGMSWVVGQVESGQGE